MADRPRKEAMNIDLFGHSLTVRSDNDPQKVARIVAYVNERLDLIQGNSRRAPTDKIALLCALNIAEELFEEREKRAALNEKVRTDSERLLGMIDRLENGGAAADS